MSRADELLDAATDEAEGAWHMARLVVIDAQAALTRARSHLDRCKVALARVEPHAGAEDWRVQRYAEIRRRAAAMSAALDQLLEEPR